MTSEQFHETLTQAYAADKAFEEAVQAAGFKSRWDTPQNGKFAQAGLQAAYDAKVKADQAMHLAFEEMRLTRAT